MLELRHVRDDEKMLIYEWANDPEVRMQSINTKLVTVEEHNVWWENRPAQFYIILQNKRPIGQVRVDDKILSYSICRSWRGRGIGTWVLRKIKSWYMYPIFAWVKNGNIASLKAFTKAKWIIERYDNEHTYWKSR